MTGTTEIHPRLLTLSGNAYREALAAAVQAAAERRSFLIVDPPADATTVAAMVREAPAIAAIVQEHGALYWPPLDGQAPSPAVAAVYARFDASRGVWRAPAGVEATVTGVPSVAVNHAQNALLAQHSVNAIRVFPRYGAVLWGARTMSSNPDFRYVNVRRTWLFVEASVAEILRGTTSGPDEVQRRIWNHLDRLWRSGAFVGNRGEDAFFVRRHRDHLLVGFAPLRPAEFLLVRVGP